MVERGEERETKRRRIRERKREREVGGRDENRKRAHSSPEVEPGRVKAKRLAGGHANLL